MQLKEDEVRRRESALEAREALLKDKELLLQKREMELNQRANFLNVSKARPSDYEVSKILQFPSTLTSGEYVMDLF